MNLDKAFSKVDGNLWNVLKTFGVGGQLFEGIKAFYRETRPCEGGKGNLPKVLL